MSKFTYALLSVVMIEVLLQLLGGSTIATTDLYNFLINPIVNAEVWKLALAALTVGVAAIVATSFFQINTYAIYAGVSIVAITFGAVLFDLFSFIQGQLSGMMGATVATQVTMVIVAPMIIFYMMAALEWTRSNS